MALTLDWSRISARVDSIDRSMRERADALAIAAHVGSYRNMWSNAMIAFDHGTPWREVDYSLLRDAIRVDAQRSKLIGLRSRLFRAYERTLGRR